MALKIRDPRPKHLRKPRREAIRESHNVNSRVRYGLQGPELVNLGYRAAEYARQNGKPMPMGGSADFHLRTDRETVRRVSQEFERDNGIAAGLVSRAVDNILGDGFTLQAATGDPAVDARLEELWKRDADRLDTRGLDQWSDLEERALLAVFWDGDVGAIKAKGFQVQTVESEQIRTPGAGAAGERTSKDGNRIIDGVEIDKLGKPLAFYVSEYSPAGQVAARTRRIAAEQFIFLAHRKRASQTRGVPPLTPNFPMLHRLNDVLDSEAAGWQILSRIAVSINRKDAAALGELNSQSDPDSAGADGKTTDRVTDVGTALIFNGEPGEEVKGVDHNVPGANFTESVTMYLRLIGLPIGFPLELVLLDWSKTNYSSARAALEQAFRNFRRWQRRLREGWHTPIYLWLIEKWLAAGEIVESATLRLHNWICAPFPWIDQLKEMEAWGMRMDRGMNTHADALKSTNRDRAEFLLVRQQEVREAIEIAKKIKSATGQDVPWEIFCGLQPPAPSLKPKPNEPPAPDGPPAAGVAE